MEKKDVLVKVGFLISYDYMFIKDSLPRVYPYADYIAFAIDSERKTWGGESFEIPDSFFEWVKDFDKENKIHIYEDSFSIPTLSSIECDVRERNMLATFMGYDGWHVFVDSDEYFFDFKSFKEYLLSLDINIPTQVYAKLITMFQKDNNGYYIIMTNETYPVATNNPNYVGCRLSGDFKIEKYTDFNVLHQSWAREDDEIKLKIRNWGHNTDFDIDAYYSFWKMINKQTYKYARSFHPLDPWLWPSLEYFDTKDISDLITRVNAYLRQRTEQEKQSEKIKLKDFIPPVLYKIKTLLTK